jgi:hypothetical protein
MRAMELNIPIAIEYSLLVSNLSIHPSIDEYRLSDDKSSFKYTNENSSKENEIGNIGLGASQFTPHCNITFILIRYSQVE